MDNKTYSAKKGTLLIITALFCLSSQGTFDPAFKVTPSAWKRLKAGEVLVTEKVIEKKGDKKELRFIVTAFVDAPPEAAWKTIRDYDRYHEFMPRLQESEAVKRNNSCIIIRYLGEVFWVKVQYYIRACAEVPGKRVVFGLAEGYESFMNSADGFWEVQEAPQGKGAVVSYSALLDPGVPVPDFITKKVARQSLVEVLQNFRKRVESGGKWKKGE